MNEVIDVLLKRRSVRAYEEREISPDVRAEILKATLRAPTAGNLMLYSILEITDQAMKDKLAVTCDNQPFIARAPMVWIFLADYQRWYNSFLAAGVDEFCRAEAYVHAEARRRGPVPRLLRRADRRQNAVIAAELFGIGSCYIGDIMERCETSPGNAQPAAIRVPHLYVGLRLPNSTTNGA